MQTQRLGPLLRLAVDLDSPLDADFSWQHCFYNSAFSSFIFSISYALLTAPFSLGESLAWVADPNSQKKEQRGLGFGLCAWPSQNSQTQTAQTLHPPIPLPTPFLFPPSLGPSLDSPWP